MSKIKGKFINLDSNTLEAEGDNLKVKSNAIIPNKIGVSSEGTKLYQPLSADTINLADNTTLDQNLYDTNNGAMVGFTRNDGTPSGGVTIEDGAMKFDGSTGYVDTGKVYDFTNKSYTISTWVKLDRTDTDMTLISDRHSSGSWGIALKLTSGKFNYAHIGSSASIINSDISPSIDTWYNIIISSEWDGTNYNIKMYVNDNVEGSSTTSVYNYQGTRPMRIGIQGFSSTTQYLNGSLDNVLIFENRALSPSEITTIYNAGKDAYSPISNGLVAQYSGKDFEGTESTPTTIYDTNMIVQGERNGSTAMRFDGVDDYVDLNKNIESNTPYTINTWIKIDSGQSGDKHIFNFNTNNDSDLIWLYYDPTTTALKTNTRVSGVNSGILQKIINEDTFYFVSLVLDGTDLKFYINGVLDSSTSSSFLASDTEQSILGGKSAFNSGSTITGNVGGSIDNVLIKDYAMTEEEIKAIYNRERTYFIDNNPAGRLGDYAVKGNTRMDGNLDITGTITRQALTSSLGIADRTYEWDNSDSDPALKVAGDIENYIKKVRVVTLDDDGVVTSVLADYDNQQITGITDGSIGQVMVEFPKIWYKEHFDGDNNLIKVEVSDFSLDGFKLHPAFSWGNGRDKIYIGAFEAGHDGTALTSVSGVATRTDRTLAQFRSEAIARKSGATQSNSNWHTMGFWQQHLLDMLFFAYYDTRHSQQVLPGYTEASTYNNAYKRNTGRSINCTSHNCSVDVDLAGVDSDLTAVMTAGNKIANRFLWIENIFGHIWKFNDGVTYVPTEAVGVSGWTGEFRAVYATADPRLFSSTDADILNNYDLLSVTPFAGSNEIWVGKVGTGFIPTTTGTNENQYWTDYHWNRLSDSGRAYLRSVLAGGLLNSGGRAGVVARVSDSGLGYSDSSRGSRLCYSEI